MKPEPQAPAARPLRGCLSRARWPWLAAAGLALLLSACGPGVGGTGTGSDLDPLVEFGARPASLCEGPQTAVAACAGAMWVDDTRAPRVSVTVSISSQGSRVELVDRCNGVRFAGEWAVVGNEPARFYGEVTVGGASQLGSMSISFGSQGMHVEVRDFAGLMLLGPLLLVSAPVPPPAEPPACGG